MPEDLAPPRSSASVMPSRPGRLQRWLGGVIAAVLASLFLWKATQFGREQGFLNDVRSGNVTGVQAYLTDGGNVAAHDLAGKTAVDLAVARGDGAMADVLLRSGATVHLEALNDAAVHGHASLLHTLLDGYSIDRLSQEDKGDLLCSAAQSGDMDTVKLLLHLGAPTDARNTRDESMTPLMYALRSGKPGVVYTLLAAGADMKARSAKGVTTLMLAAAWNAPIVCQYLLKNGADVNAADNAGNTPLMLAASVGNVPTTDLLIGYGASVNAKNKAGKSVLGWATESGNTRLIALLNRHGAHP